MNSEPNRLERIEALIESNARAIEALTANVNDFVKGIFPRIDEMQRQIFNMQRQVVDVPRRIDDNTADIRELALENQRILKYLESKL